MLVCAQSHTSRPVCRSKASMVWRACASGVIPWVVLKYLTHSKRARPSYSQPNADRIHRTATASLHRPSPCTQWVVQKSSNAMIGHKPVRSNSAATASTSRTPGTSADNTTLVSSTTRPVWRAPHRRAKCAPASRSIARRGLRHQSHRSPPRPAPSLGQGELVFGGDFGKHETIRKRGILAVR